MSVDHAFLLLLQRFSQGILFAQKRGEPVEQQNKTNVGSYKQEANCVAASHVGADSKIGSSFAVDSFLTVRLNDHFHSKQVENVFVELLISQRKVVKDPGRNFDVEENVETGHGEVVDEAEEVNADRNRRDEGRHFCCGTGCNIISLSH